MASFPQDQQYWQGGDFIFLGQGQPARCLRQCAWQNPACDLICVASLDCRYTLPQDCLHLSQGEGAPLHGCNHADMSLRVDPVLRLQVYAVALYVEKATAQAELRRMAQEGQLHDKSVDAMCRWGPLPHCFPPRT